MWTCVACTLKNDSWAEKCRECRTDRPAEGEVVFKGEIPLRILQGDDLSYEGMRAQVVGHLEPVANLCHQIGGYLSRSTLVLPRDDAGFFAYLTKEIGDEYVLQLLAGKGLINFNPRAEVLPLRTLGDGNCLLHAACMGMWTIDDHDRVLRNAMSVSLASSPTPPAAAAAVVVDDSPAEAVTAPAPAAAPAMSSWIANVRARWWADTQRVLASMPEGFAVIGDADVEWAHVVALPSLTVGDLRPDGRALGIGGISLMAVHVYILAQMVLRPIVVFADDAAAADSGDTMAGIYLPSTVDPAACTRAPLQLAYTPGHFTLLVASAPTTIAGGPVCALCNGTGTPLPLRFEDPAIIRNELLSRYLDLVRLPNGGDAALIPPGILPDAAAVLDTFLAHARERYTAMRAL